MGPHFMSFQFHYTPSYEPTDSSLTVPKQKGSILVELLNDECDRVESAIAAKKIHPTFYDWTILYEFPMILHKKIQIDRQFIEVI